MERTEYVHKGKSQFSKKKEPPPAGIRLTKGSVHIAASREFVDYVINDPLARQFTDWLKDTGVPDETLFSSLNHSPDLLVPGAYKGTCVKGMGYNSGYTQTV